MKGSAFVCSDVAKALEEACENLYVIVNGVVQSRNGRVVGGSWKKRLSEALKLASSVLNELNESVDTDDEVTVIYPKPAA